MIGEVVKHEYLATIGIECHVQLKTATKLFAAVGNDAREAAPNTLVSHICFGLPGALPVLNEKAVHLAAKAAYALGSTPQKFSKFDRKHYFYPDLPKGYQISQYDQPIILGGHIEIEVNGEVKKVGITRAHLEEDAGKSTHPSGADYTLVDLNRAGTPLLEIVSEPDIHTPAEAKAYARELYLRMRYAGISDADLYYGNMRFDVNVSVSKDRATLGTRTETKNLNSFRSVEKSVEYEINRQIELLERGEAIVQETRGWNEAKQKTFIQRTKEEAHDYRYMPDPDLPPVVLSDDYINKVKKEMPVMPSEWRKRLESLGLDISQVETLLDGELESEKISYLPAIERFLNQPDTAKYLANWFVNVTIPSVREGKFKLGSENNEKLLLEIEKLVNAKKLSSTSAKALYLKIVANEDLPSSLEGFAEKNGYIQVSDEGEITKIVQKVLSSNPQAAEDVKNGELKAIGFLVGQVMKDSKGQANPQLAQKLIKEQLGL